MGFVHFLFFFHFFFFSFLSLFFPPSFLSLSFFSFLNFTLECSLPCISLSGSLFLLNRVSRFANWECCSVCGLVWMLWPSLAQSNPLGEVGQERLCQRGEQRAALCSLDTKAKYSARRWGQAWVWWLSVAPHLGWAKWITCCWGLCMCVGEWPTIEENPWCSFACVSEDSVRPEITFLGKSFRS